MVRISRNRLDMEEGRIDRAIFKDYGETLVGGLDGINSSTAYTIDLENGNAFHVILTGNCTFTFSNPTPVGSAQTFTLFLKQDPVGGRTVTWPSSVQWVQGYTPIPTSQKNRYDTFQFTTTDAGATWLGFVSSQNYEEKVQLWSWGYGSSGKLGHNNTTSFSSPTQVGNLQNWNSVAGGSYHSVAVKTDGTLWSWGNGGTGRLGSNAVAAISSPAQIGALTNWSRIAAGEEHTLAIKTDGTLWSWGRGNYGGRLGHNSSIHRSSPTIVGALTNWAFVAAASGHSLAVKTDGTLWTWGYNQRGRLGDNTTISRSSPTIVGASTNWAKISTSPEGRHSLALKTDGTMWSWGDGQYYGRLGLNDVGVSRSSPTQIGSGTNWTHIAAGYAHNLALKADGTLWTWGNGYVGQLGLEDVFELSSPTQIGSDTDWALIAVGKKHSHAIKTDGTFWSWGYGGQIGNNNPATLSRSSPTQVGFTHWKDVAVGHYHVMTLRFP